MEEIEPVEGNLYRLRSRNIPYGVYCKIGFIGIREKFGDLYLTTEWGAPLEDLGPVPDGIEIAEYLGSGESATFNKALYDFLADAEAKYGRGVGYGGRPGDEDV